MLLASHDNVLISLVDPRTDNLLGLLQDVIRSLAKRYLLQG